MDGTARKRWVSWGVWVSMGDFIGCYIVNGGGGFSLCGCGKGVKLGRDIQIGFGFLGVVCTAR